MYIKKNIKQMSETNSKLREVEELMDSIPKFSSTGKSAANFDLSRMRKLCKRMENPQNNFKSIHVAGTNGKGTVCRMLASVYQQAGCKVGLYTSPHLVDFRERFQINANFIETELLLEFFDRFGEFIHESKFTYFEITTAIAFWYFSKQKVDIAVLEVGLGGKLDATNVVNPLISVITSIGLDHIDILGDTIEEIAFEKAGIIKQNRPVVIGELEPEASSVIKKIAKDKSAKLKTIDSIQAEYQDQKIILKVDKSVLTLNGKHWKKIDANNAAVVYCVIQELNDDFSVDDLAFKQGIDNIPQRFRKRAVFEKLLPDYDWYFDGAHNAESVKSLTTHLSSLESPIKWTVVLSFMKDKLTPEVAKLWNNFSTIYLYPMKGERAASLKEMKAYFPTAKTMESPDQLQSDQFKSELVIFSGSFYFYSIVSNWMGAIASADQLNPSAL